MKKITTLVAILFFSVITIAQTFEIDNISYNITSNTDPYAVEVISKIPEYDGDIIIPEQTFYNDIFYTVKIISEDAFRHCELLTSLSIPQSIDSIAIGSFYGCAELSSILCDEGNQTFTTIDNVLYDKEVTRLIQFPAANENNTYSFPISVTTIESGAFSYCCSLSSLIIPDHIVGAIKNLTFSNTSGIETITIGNGVTEIEFSAFSSCEGLQEINIGESLEIFGLSSVFYCFDLMDFNVSSDNPFFKNLNGILYNYNMDTLIRCPEGKSVVSIPSSVETLHKSSFEYCKNIIEILIPNNVINMGRNCFRNCTEMTTITLSNSISKIPFYGFNTCSKLDNLTIPESVNYIDAWSFTHCDSLKYLSLGNNVDTIQQGAFQSCISLKNLVIPDNVSFIGSGVFNNCYALDSVSIGYSIRTIGNGSFNECTQLSYFKCCATELPDIGYIIFNNVPTNMQLYVPTESLSDYQQADQWSDFTIYGTKECNSNAPIHNAKIDYCIYPNPTTDIITLSNSENLNDVIFKMYNLKGELLITIEIEKSMQVSLMDFDSGIYLYQIVSNKNILNGKIVKL